MFRNVPGLIDGLSNLLQKQTSLTVTTLELLLISSFSLFHVQIHKYFLFLRYFVSSFPYSLVVVYFLS